jgi:uncharacterized protein YggE
MRAVCCAVLFLFSLPMQAQSTAVNFIADAVVVQAEGSFEADPDLATLTFRVFSQDKDIKHAYDAATQSMQRIANLAEHSGLQKQDVTTGVLEVRPFYEGDRKKKIRSYAVHGEMTLRVHDFSRIGTLLDSSVEDGVSDFRSLTYSLADEEQAKQQAVAEAMRRAIGRASTALEQKGQKLGPLRYMNLDIKQLYGVAQLPQPIAPAVAEFTLEAQARNELPPPGLPLPPLVPEKVTISATVQCAFQIQ